MQNGMASGKPCYYADQVTEGSHGRNQKLFLNLLKMT